MGPTTSVTFWPEANMMPTHIVFKALPGVVNCQNFIAWLDFHFNAMAGQDRNAVVAKSP